MEFGRFEASAKEIRTNSISASRRSVFVRLCRRSHGVLSKILKTQEPPQKSILRCGSNEDIMARAKDHASYPKLRHRARSSRSEFRFNLSKSFLQLLDHQRIPSFSHVTNSRRQLPSSLRCVRRRCAVGEDPEDSRIDSYGFSIAFSPMHMRRKGILVGSIRI